MYAVKRSGAAAAGALLGRGQRVGGPNRVSLRQASPPLTEMRRCCRGFHSDECARHMTACLQQRGITHASATCARS